MGVLGKTLCGFLLLCSAWSVSAQPLTGLIHSWEKANFLLDGEEQKLAFDALLEKAEELREGGAISPEYLLWAGIIESSYAGEIGGLTALGHAKQAKKDFEAALDLDPSGVNGAALGSLGTLYSKVPGWPIGFGSAKKARALFEQAENEGANSLDFYIMYAEFALEQNDTMLARRLLDKAAMVPTRPDRQVTDAARHKERKALLEVL